MQHNHTRIRHSIASITITRFILLATALIVGSLDIVLILSQDAKNVTARDLNPVWSTNGLYIAFESNRSGNNDIWMYDLTHGTSINLTMASEHDEHSPVWFPTDDKIIYVSEYSGNSDIYVLDVESLETRNITNTNMVKEIAPSLSSDGRYLAFAAATEERQDIVVYDFDTLEFINLTSDQSSEIFGLPNWYSQENILVFTDSPLDEETNLWTSKPDQETLQQITHGGRDTVPIWSPVEMQIVMASRRSGNFDIWVYDLPNSKLINLTANNNRLDAFPAWSHDGTQIAYVASSEYNGKSRQDIWTTNITTGIYRNLTLDVTQATSPAWSPSDDRIAFVSWETESIWLIDADGSNAINLTGDGQTSR